MMCVTSVRIRDATEPPVLCFMFYVLIFGFCEQWVGTMSTTEWEEVTQ
jgi:hypothetical protein